MQKNVVILTCCLLFISGITQGGPAVNTATLVAVTRQPLLPILEEISGLASTDNRYWGINDSGGEPALYGFSQQNFKRLNVVKITNASNFDWEDLAQDQQFIYIADSGDNFAWRSSIHIYKVDKQQLSSLTGNGQLNSQKITITYTDKHNIIPQKNHNFDSEALAVVNDKLWLFSKNRADGLTKLYIIDKNIAQQQVAPAASFEVNGLITAVDYRPKTGQLLLLGYSQNALFGQSFIWRVDVQEQQVVWESAQRYRIKPYAQWESIKWIGDDRFILAAEDSPLGTQQLAVFQLPNKR